MSGNYCKLCACKFGFALGLIWGLGVLILGWAAWLWGYGTPVVLLWSHVYLGYSATFLGGLWGGLWGLVDFFIFGLLVAWVYNGCLGCCKKTSCGPTESTD